MLEGEGIQLLPVPKRKHNFWVRIGIWVGINLTVLGVITTLISYLMPRRETIVGQMEGFAVLDLWAVSYNSRLELCQLTGLASLVSGSAVIITCLLISFCRRRQTPSYCIMGTTVLSQTFVDTYSVDPWILPHSLPTNIY